MDEDIREHLKEVGENLEGIGLQVASATSMDSIRIIIECLRENADTLDMYLTIQIIRDSTKRTKK
jgi:hypothetical protein